jgi:pimeloyl-ACP methyl ester carboxylesterase
MEGYADPTAGGDLQAGVAAMIAMWGTGELQHVLNPDMPWNEEIRKTWALQERLAASPATVALMMPLVSGLDVQVVLPTVRVPTLVLQHTNDPLIVPAMGRYIADHIPDAKYVEVPGRNMYHFAPPYRYPRSRSVISHFVGCSEGPQVGRESRHGTVEPPT